MEYKQDQIFRMQQFDVPKMPFYMSYPMQNLYLTEMEYEKDMERMKELYPGEVKRILELVDEECDKMEYEGSLMFDEYPDRMMVDRITGKIYQNMNPDREGMQAEELWGGKPPLPPEYGGAGAPGRMPPPPPPERNDPLYCLIGVILSNEMYRRRCRHRRCRRWW